MSLNLSPPSPSLSKIWSSWRFVTSSRPVSIHQFTVFQTFQSSYSWGSVVFISKIWSSWRFVTSSRPVSIHQFTVFQTFQSSCSWGPVVFIWCQSPGCSLCKRIYCLSWAYLERKSQIWPYIYNQRKQSSSTYFENERSGSQLSIWKHLVCNITAIMHNVYVKYIYSGMPLSRDPMLQDISYSTTWTEAWYKSGF